MLDVRHLRALVGVADTGSVTAAAGRLYIAQQALSRTVQDAERLLGRPVFRRGARGMAVRREARPLITRARAALDMLATLPHDDGRLAADPGDPVATAAEVWPREAPLQEAPLQEAPLRVGLVECGAPALALAGALAALRLLGRPVEVAPVPMLRHPAAVLDGALDVGFWVGFRETLPARLAEVAAVHPLAPEPTLGVLLPAGHPLAGAAVVDPADLGALAAIDWPHRLMPAELDEQGRRLRAAGWRGRVALEHESGATINALVAAGAGWVHVAPSAADQAVPGTVYRPLADGGGTPYVAWMLVRHDAPDAARPFAAALAPPTGVCRAGVGPRVE
jgi:DNA-binding transcriptional LysR family regulator